MDLKVASLNVRGLENFTKIREVFNWLRTKEMSIYMLQEVHWSVDTSDLCASSKAGISILFKTTLLFVSFGSF